MVRRHVTTLLAVLVALSACSGRDWSPADSDAPAGRVIEVPDVLKLGESADITGEKGQPLTGGAGGPGRKSNRYRSDLPLRGALSAVSTALGSGRVHQP
ncbi:hypothetical protein Acor_19500 [Acrocarpospora corrugata]|uniref:Lipoprotein n=1 Tax=Acrocarpospora corrugata TaxID=35763 RepID=A0A5M3VSY6_9ACTN|nr:hypothetical protein Acor_19500 [Acrocarpospora corrugata]